MEIELGGRVLDSERTMFFRSVHMPLRFLNLFSGWAIAACCIFTARGASASPPSACPSREEVESAVRALLSRSHAEVEGLDSKFFVEDLGDSYVVSALDTKRSFSDESRDCGKRADVAAVFVALTLAPPDIQSPESEPEPAASPKEVPRPVITLPRQEPIAAATIPPNAELSFSIEFALGGVAAWAPRTDGGQASLGGELALRLVRRSWGLTALVGYELSSGWELESVPLREQRVPVALLMSRAWDLGGVRLVGELGPTVHFLKLRQVESARGRTVALSQFGARGFAQVRFARSLSPYAAISLEFLPGARDIEVEPRGRIGATSSLWLGASVGFVAKLP